MKLIAHLGNQERQVEIRREGEAVFASVDDRMYQLHVSEPEENVYLFKDDGRISEVFVSPAQNAPGSFNVRIASAELEIAISDPKRLRGTGSGAEAVGGKAEIRTAMPGKVVRVLADIGASVKKGDGIIVVEAMKMQNEMRSPKDGIVIELRVSEGDTVGAGDILLVIE